MYHGTQAIISIDLHDWKIIFTALSCTYVQTSKFISTFIFKFLLYFTYLSFDKLPDIPVSSAAFS